MKRFKEFFFHGIRLTSFCVVLLVVLHVFSVQAGAPRIEGKCQDRNGRQVSTWYDSLLQVFAEVRMLPGAQQYEAKIKGVSEYVIVINPERYYLGRYTQSWLYQRQCAHIQQNHKVITNPRAFDYQEEQSVDCLAIQLMRSDKNLNLSNRQIDSIERDLERLIRNRQWADVLPGPERRVSLKGCP